MNTSTLLEVECSHISHTYNIVMEIKWICPTAPVEPISGFGGFHSTACDAVVPYKFGEKSSRALTATGFQDVMFKSYNGCRGHCDSGHHQYNKGLILEFQDADQFCS